MADIVDKIANLKKQRNAVILAHNYQIPEVQEIADFVGDSLDLSIRAREARESTIVFCGVRFMAETAAILSPAKKVLLPDETAGCPLADMITAQDVKKLRKKHPGAPVVCYVNTSAEVKAQSDICCTSANAVEVVHSLSTDEIIFIPDKYLGSYVQSKTDKKLILWKGFCPTHQTFDPKSIIGLKQDNPSSVVMMHPEANPDALEVADYIGGTGGMSKFVQDKSGTFIVGTENGMIYRLQKENPEAVFLAASARAICPNMKKISLEKVLWALEDDQFVVSVPQPAAQEARRALDKMLALI